MAKLRGGHLPRASTAAIGNGMRTITIADICKTAGCHRTTALRAANRLNLGEKIGVQLLFTQEESEQIIATVRPGQPGNPGIAEHSQEALKKRWKNKG